MEPSTRTVYGADVVGSMLRPRELVEARRALRAGEIGAPELIRLDLPECGYEDIALVGAQCGFASAAEVAGQRKITEQTQADKRRLVARTAHAVRG